MSFFVFRNESTSVLYLSVNLSLILIENEFSSSLEVDGAVNSLL